jgi:Mg-chelatase subunit ChlD
MLTTSLVHTQPISENDPQELIPCALRISVAQSDTRVPTHFIILLDTSDSMNEDNKLENVKQCIRLLMNILGQNDYISLITFATDSRVVLNRVAADSTHRSMIEHTIGQIRTDGMTNLSAGLSSVYSIMQGEQLKTGLLLLTDGHANTGTSSTANLRTMMESLLESYSMMSLSCVAYGTNHNSELLQAFTCNSNGSYCIVNSLEDTAVAVGDVLGGLMSCAAQNVDFLWPLGTEIEGMYQYSTIENHVVMRYGDMYSGSDKIILAKVPSRGLSQESPVQIRGMEIPAFQPFTHDVGRSQFLTGRDRDIRLTHLQIQCSSIFRSIRGWQTLAENRRADLEAEIEFFARCLDDDFLVGHPVHGMLQEELRSIRNALATVRASRGPNPDLNTMLSQHETFVGLGRGATSSIQAPHHRHQRIRRQAARGLDNSTTTAADPEEEPESPPLSSQMTSPHQTAAQRRVTNVLRTLSTQH